MDREFILNISINSVVFGLDSNHLNTLLIRQDINHEDILSHRWRLPGGLIKWDEDPESTYDRILKELTGLQNIKKYQLRAFGVLDSFTKLPNSSYDAPEDRTITIPYYSVIDLNKVMGYGLNLNYNIRWFPVEKVKSLNILHDHFEILEFALETLRNELQTSSFVFEFLPIKFTLGQLQKIYEIIFGIKIDKRNFRKKISKLNYIVPLKEKETGVSHRPANLYMFSHDQYKKLFIERSKMLPYFDLA